MNSRSILLGACSLLLTILMTLPATAQTTSDNVGFTRFAHTAVESGQSIFTLVLTQNHL